MIEILPALCLTAGLGLLITLTIIDFKTLLLPNIYVAPFGALGILFHWSTNFYYLDLFQIAIGGVGAYILLYIIRAAGNKYYGQDSLGLGDVKLLAAAGLWVGFLGVIYIMTIGAAFTLAYGIAFALYQKAKTGNKLSLSRLTVPAGPGFIIGIIAIIGWMYQSTIIEQFYTLAP